VDKELLMVIQKLTDFPVPLVNVSTLVKYGKEKRWQVIWETRAQLF
jgi:hypothetical protein